jgi:hypothetical protein
MTLSQGSQSKLKHEKRSMPREFPKTQAHSHKCERAKEASSNTPKWIPTLGVTYLHVTKIWDKSANNKLCPKLMFFQTIRKVLKIKYHKCFHILKHKLNGQNNGHELN